MVPHAVGRRAREQTTLPAHGGLLRARRAHSEEEIRFTLRGVGAQWLRDLLPELCPESRTREEQEVVRRRPRRRADRAPEAVAQEAGLGEEIREISESASTC